MAAHATWPEAGTFISLPPEAFEIVQALMSGKTLGEARDLYLAAHGELPDIEDLLEALAARGFVDRVPLDGETRQAHDAKTRQFHFTWVSQRTAQRIFSRPVLLLCAAVIAAALAALFLQPSLLPGWRALFFESNMTPLAITIMGLGLLTTFFHEMAHLLAARARGISCRLSLGNRLWILVAETDMTGIWALPKRQRYLPLLAGPLFDLTAGSALFLVLFAASSGWLSLAPMPRQLLAALVLGALLRLLWQCFFFVRTDFYYVFANLFGCKRLMQDTQLHLRHCAARWTGRRAPPEPPLLSKREMRGIHLYSIFWVFGRGLAFGSLFFVTLPLVWTYSAHLGSSLLHAESLSRYQLADSVLSGDPAHHRAARTRAVDPQPSQSKEIAMILAATKLPPYQELTGCQLAVLRAPAGKARSRLLGNWARHAEQAGATVHRLGCDFMRGGPWSGVKDLVEQMLPRLEVEAPDLVRRHATEIFLAAPLAGRRYGLASPSLTDTSVPEEKVRNYPIDRAFRLVQGLVDLVADWHTRRSAGPLVLVCEAFADPGALACRFFRELLRREGQRLQLTLLAVLYPRQGLPPLFQGISPPLEIDLDLDADRQEAPGPRAMAALARELEAKAIQGYAQGLETLSALIDAWQNSDQPSRALLWQAQAFGQYNHLGFYEDAMRHGAVVETNIDRVLELTNAYTRWNLVGALANCHLAAGQPEAALAVIEKEGQGKIHDLADRVKLLYVAALIHARFLPRPDFTLAERYLREALDFLEASTLPATDRAFLHVFTSNGLAYVRHRQGRPDQAIELCRSGFELLERRLAPDQHRLHRSVLLYNMAQVYASLKQFDEAVQHYTQAMRFDPNYSEYYNERGNAYLGMGRLDQAIEDYRQAILLSAPYQEVWTNLAQAFRLKKDYTDALAAYSRAIELEPRQLLAHLGRAQTYEALGRNAEAIRDYGRALELDPAQPLTLANRAALLYESGHLADSIADLGRAIQLAPDNPDFYWNRATALDETGEGQAAVQDRRTYLTLLPDAPDRDVVLARIALSETAHAASGA